MMTSQKDIFAQQLQSRLQTIMQAFVESRDVSPALLYGTEGYIACGIELGLIAEQDVRQQIRDLALKVLGEDAAADFPAGPDAWLPMRMQKAPVYPSKASVDSDSPQKTNRESEG